MVHVRCSAHLRQDSGALIGGTLLLGDTIAEVLHAADAIQHVVTPCVDSASHPRGRATTSSIH